MIYLDNSATTKPRPEAAAAVNRAMTEVFGNPSSAHRLGAEAERLVREARQAVAAALGVDEGEIVFTSGGTEANNLALMGAARARRRQGGHIVTTAVEHPSVLRACGLLEEEGFRITRLPVDRTGVIDPEDLAGALTGETILVSTMYVNNEVGAVQPLEAVARVLAGLERSRRPVWHVDAVQAFGKLPVFPRRLGIDLLTVSAHKIHGPKGCGALYVRKGLVLKPLMGGGGQEGGLRAGTENVPGIAGFGAAVRLAMAEQPRAAERLAELRRRFLAALAEVVPDAVVNGPAAPAGGPAGGGAAPHIVNVSLPGLRGEVLVHALEERGVFVSTGAACSSRRNEPSHVLRAMGLGRDMVESALRFSFSPLNTADEAAAAAKALAAVVSDLRGFVRR